MFMELVASGDTNKAAGLKHSRRSLEHIECSLERHKWVGDLSGDKQRICLANFATDPDLFVLDEPTAVWTKLLENDFIIYYIMHVS